MDTNCGSLEQTFSLQQQTTTLFTTFSMPALEEIQLATNKTHQKPKKKPTENIQNCEQNSAQKS